MNRLCVTCDDGETAASNVLVITSSGAKTETDVCGLCLIRLVAPMAARRWSARTICPDCGGDDVKTVSVYVGAGQHIVWEECQGCDWHSPETVEHEAV